MAFEFDDRTTSIIERFARARKIMVFVGAGVSAEAGLPTWDELTGRLLTNALRHRLPDATDADVASWVADTLQTESLPGAAAIAEVMLPDDLAHPLREQLFAAHEAMSGQTLGATDYFPGPTARAIARLRAAYIGTEPRHEPPVLMTTNFDDLLVVALRSEPELSSFETVPWVGAEQEEPESPHVKVYHLHGYLGRDETRGDIVLTDHSFLRSGRRNEWRQREVTYALCNMPCLFIGTSLSDFNLLRYLHQAQDDSSHTHAVVFVRQADVPEEEVLRKVREDVAIERWGRQKLDVAFVDHFADVAQIVDEIGLRITHGDRYKSLECRASPFLTRVLHNVIGAHDASVFRDQQFKLNGVLTELLGSLVELLSQRNIDVSNETLGLAMWLLSPSGEELTAWASSDRLHCSPSTLRPLRMLTDNRWVAAKTVRSGTIRIEGREASRSRWGFIIGVPLYYSHELGRIPCGAVTITTFSEAADTNLRHVSRRTELEELVEHLFTPLLGAADF